MKRTPFVVLSCMGAVGLALMLAPAWAGERGQDKTKLPAAVARAVEENRPHAEIDKLEIEKKDGITLYDIEFKGDQGEIEVAEDGTVLDIVSIVEMKDISKAAAQTIQRVAQGAQIKRLEKSEVRAEIKSEAGKGRIVKLQSLRYVFEAELLKGNQTGEVEVAEDGSIIELKWDE